jgi:hypothetical protein
VGKLNRVVSTKYFNRMINACGKFTGEY